MERKRNERELRTVSIKDLRIKTKRDWVIFWVLTVLADYTFVARFFEKKVAALLVDINLQFDIWQFDIWRAAVYYGRLIAGVVILGIVIEIVLFLCRKSVKAKLTALAAVILLSLALAGACRIHCGGMASAGRDQEPGDICSTVCLGTSERK